MALPELANSTVETFWENYWCEEDEADDLLFPEEGGDQTNTLQMKIQQYQEEVKEAGMWKVGDQASWIGKLKETLKNALQTDWGDLSPENIDKICEAIERAGRATCFVQRNVNSCTRITFHEKQINGQANNDKAKKSHKEMLEKAKNGKGASGTGFLMHPKHKKGWFVITNNHVIMDNTEARSAKVVFDYLEDSSNKDTRVFAVSEIVAKSLRTANTQDEKTLDFSVLLLEVDSSDADKFLEDHALGFEESERVQAGDKQQILNVVKLNFLPTITFSHPHGLAKRISIGQYPTVIKECPAAHITHDIPTTTGSSGANLLFSFVDKIDDKVFQYWKAGFVHYRHSKAIAWQAIGNSLRTSLSSIESSHSAEPSTGINSNILTWGKCFV